MKGIFPQLVTLDFVRRVLRGLSADENDKALGPSALFKQNGTLTALGWFYASHKYQTSVQHPKGQEQEEPDTIK